MREEHDLNSSVSGSMIRRKRSAPAAGHQRRVVGVRRRAAAPLALAARLVTPLLPPRLRLWRVRTRQRRADTRAREHTRRDLGGEKGKKKGKKKGRKEAGRQGGREGEK